MLNIQLKTSNGVERVCTFITVCPRESLNFASTYSEHPFVDISCKDRFDFGFYLFDKLRHSDSIRSHYRTGLLSGHFVRRRLLIRRRVARISLLMDQSGEARGHHAAHSGDG